MGRAGLSERGSLHCTTPNDSDPEYTERSAPSQVRGQRPAIAVSPDRVQKQVPSLTCWHTPETPVIGRPRQEDRKPELWLGNILTYRGPVSELSKKVWGCGSVHPPRTAGWAVPAHHLDAERHTRWRLTQKDVRRLPEPHRTRPQPPQRPPRPEHAQSGPSLSLPETPLGPAQSMRRSPPPPAAARTFQ